MWKIQLTIAINFISSKGNNEECVIHSKSDNTGFMIHDFADQVIEERFQSLLYRYQIGLETSIRGSDFTFECVHLLYYKCHKVNPNRGRSYIDSPDGIKTKKVTINPVKKKCFQYSITVALNHEEIKKNPHRKTKIRAFINKYN